MLIGNKGFYSILIEDFQGLFGRIAPKIVFVYGNDRPFGPDRLKKGL